MTATGEANLKALESRDQYTVGWIAALPIELAAATAMLDDVHNEPQNFLKAPHDKNSYTWGRIGDHNVVIAILPESVYGTVSAATTATQMLSSFPQIRIGLMVGIGAAIPRPGQEQDIRLGDIIVSHPEGQCGGVVQYDLGKATAGDQFERRGVLHMPPEALLKALAKLQAQHEMRPSRVPEILQDMVKSNPYMARQIPGKASFVYQGSENDRLFKATCVHVSGRGCDNCDLSDAITRDNRDSDEPEIHYGVIASGNQLVKDAAVRDQIARDCGAECICLEMEAAGLMNTFPCLVIRGVCDYADSHKNDRWQKYASATAAAYAKEFLGVVPGEDLEKTRKAADVLNNISKDVGEIQTVVQGLNQAAQYSQHKALLDWLTPTNYGAQQSEILRDRQQGTGLWLFQSTDFGTWLHHKGLTLFCPGMPGSGKTVIMSIVVEHIGLEFKHQLEVGVAYVYCNYRRREEQRLEDLLASLLKQLIQGQGDISQSVADLYKSHQAHRTRPSMTELSRALYTTASGYSRVFILIDALDECRFDNHEREQLLATLFELQSVVGVNIFITSRHIPDIERRLKERSMVLEIQASPADVRKYIESRIARLPDYINKNPGLQEEIKDAIVEAVKGMFLLARLHFESLMGMMTPAKMREALARLPTGSEAYDKAYEDAMGRVGSQIKGRKTLAMQVLSWITCAKRPMTVVELRHALAIEENSTVLDYDNRPELRDMVSTCEGLVTVEEESNIIRLIHYTTQEYLERSQETWFPGCQNSIGLACVVYLSFDTFRDGHCPDLARFEARLKYNPLYDYAARHWGHHVDDASIQSRGAISKLFCHGNKLSGAVQALMIDHEILYRKDDCSQDIPRNVTGGHLAAYFGLHDTMACLLRDGLDLNAEDSFGSTPLDHALKRDHPIMAVMLIKKSASKMQGGALHSALYEASSRGYSEVVRMLLDKDVGNAAKGSALISASCKGHVEVVQLLLHEGVDIDARYEEDSTALIIASSEGRSEIVRLLLDKGADVNVSSGRGDTALLEASSRGHSKVVRLLLDEVTRLPSKSSYEHALGRAITAGHREIVQMLLEAGADPNQVRYCNAPLDALYEGHTEIVLLLLESGADVETRGGEYGNILQGASAKGYTEIVQMLLSKGADVNAQCGQHGNALQAASVRGHQKIVEMLLDCGANINAQGSCQYSNELHEAVADDKYNAISMLLSEGARIRCSSSQHGIALQAASSRGYKAVVQMLLDKGADVNAVGGRYGNSLQAALAEGNHDIAKMLLDKGADVKLCGGKYRTALQAASFKGCDYSLLQVLFNKGAYPDDQGGFYGNALQAASHQGHEEIVQALLNKGANVNAQGGQHGTALQAASFGGHDRIIHMLLAKGANVEIQCQRAYPMMYIEGCVISSVIETAQGTDMTDDQDYSNALEAASANGHRSIVETLLSKGANPRNGFAGDAIFAACEQGHDEIVQLLVNKIDRLSDLGTLQRACAQGHDKIVQILLNKGVDVNTQGGRYRNSLEAAVYTGRDEIAQMLLERGAFINPDCRAYNFDDLRNASAHGHKTIARIILDIGVDVNAISRDGDTALIAASKQGDLEILQMLLDRGADVNIQSRVHKKTAMHHAADNGHESAAGLLIKQGSRLDLQDELGETAIHYAAKNGHASVVRLLIQHGSRVDLQDELGQQPLHHATAAGHLSVVHILVESGSRLDTYDLNYRTPLICAQQNDHIPVINWLLSLNRPLEPFKLSGTVSIENVSEDDNDTEEDATEISVTRKRCRGVNERVNSIRETKRFKSGP